MSDAEGGGRGKAVQTGPSEPELRAGPPWLMEEMVDALPDLAAQVLRMVVPPVLSASVRQAGERGEPIVTVGCGTSEHAARAVAALLEEALPGEGGRSRRPIARQAFEAALDPMPGGMCIGISHEGTTRATIQALHAARSAGASTVLITAVPDSPAAQVARHILPTPLVDRSWCHTVGYLSPLLAGAALAAATRGDAPDPDTASDLLARALASAREHADGAAATLAEATRLVIVGSGVDRITAHELALKIEEGARIPARALDLETLLHGHLSPCDALTGLVVCLTDPLRSTDRLGRALQALAAARALEMPAVIMAGRETLIAEASLLSESGIFPMELPDPIPGVSPVLGSLLVGAAGLQRLALALIHRRGVNPDRIGRERAANREAAALAEAAPRRPRGTIEA